MQQRNPIQVVERILAGDHAGTAITQFLEDNWGEGGRTIGMTVNAFSLIAGLITLVNFVIGAPLPTNFVAGLALLVGLHAAVETGIGAVLNSEVDGFKSGIPSPYFIFNAVLFSAMLGFVARGLWIFLGDYQMSKAVFFGTMSLIFMLWARADW